MGLGQVGMGRVLGSGPDGLVGSRLFDWVLVSNQAGGLRVDPDILWASGSGTQDLIGASVGICGGGGLWEVQGLVVATGGWRQAGGRALSPQSSESEHR